MRVFFTKWRFAFVVILVLLAACWFSRGIFASFLFNRGVIAKNEWRLTTANSYFDWSLFLKESFDARFEKGLCLQLRGDFLSSQKEFDTLLKTRIEDKTNLSRLHNAIGFNRFSFAEHDDAVTSYQQALGLARSAGNRRLEAESLINLSRVFYYAKGKFDDALVNLQQAKAIAREISDERIEAAALRNTGVVYWWFKGELDRPLREFYFPALELYRRQNDQRGAATTLTLIALVFINKGDVYRFMQYQNESIEIQQRIGDEAGLSDSYMAMGDIYDAVGNYRKALEFFRKSLAITERTGYRLVHNQLQAYLAQLHLNLDEYDEAIKFYDPSLSHKNKDSVPSPDVAYCYQLKGDYAQALSLYERVLRAFRQENRPDVRFETNTLLRSAECSIALGDWESASRFTEQAEEVFQKIDTHSGGEIGTAIVRAKLAQHEGRHEQALRYFQDALETEAQIFASASTNSLIPPHRRVYENLFGFLLDYSLSNTDEKISKKANELAFSFLENARYRSLRNFLIQVRERRADAPQKSEKERELTERIKRLSQNLKQKNNEATREQLRKAYNEYEEHILKAQLERPQYLAIRAAKPVALSEVQQKLSTETALIEFLFVGEKVFALVVTQKNLQSILLPVSKSALAAKTKLFRSRIFTDEVDETDWLPVAESLRGALLEPLEKKDLLRDVKRIGFIPQGFLHGLPFAALTRREENNIKFLIEDYSLFQTPSATFYSNNNDSALGQLSTLAFGRNNSPEENLPTLDFAEEEARVVAHATNGTALINKQASETEIKQRARDTAVLHLATHSISESEMPLFSRLLLEPTQQDDGSLTVREIFELGLKTNLVTLSACDTGQSYSASGNESNEQDRVGLIEAFLHAGSESVLASLFPVSDKPTADLMAVFYKNLQTHNKADALAQTQRTMIQHEKLNHPRYWSPFVLVGTDR